MAQGPHPQRGPHRVCALCGYRVTFKGPGGHSYGAFGIANPVHALGRAISRIADLQVPRLPKTTFNVGRIGGGTSVNTISADAWMEVDMRWADPAALTALDAGFQKALDIALAEENERWGNNGRLTMEKTVVGHRPAGAVEADAPIVLAAVSVTFDTANSWQGTARALLLAIALVQK
jgi:tripeptide aminopeptidase